MTDAAMPVEVPEKAAASARRGVLTSRLVLVISLVLLAMANVLLAGYQLGVGNQTIQVPFLKWYANHSLYSTDPMVTGTIGDYPSYFFQGLALLVGRFGLQRTYLALHFLTTLGVLSASYWLIMVMFRDRLAAVFMLLLLMMGHHQALAGDAMYSLGFTHTWFVFPIAILAMGMFYRGWTLRAFLLTGLMFNLHALTASYLLFMFGFCSVFQLRQVGFWRLCGGLLIFAAVASPTALEMIRHKQVFDAQWIALTRIRSADHSFPSNWWQTGTPDIPRFVMLFAVWVLSLSFPAGRDRQRKSLVMALAVLILFAAGVVFADIHPVPTVLRAQLFRSSRLLMVIMFAHTAFMLACMIRRPWPRFDAPGAAPLQRTPVDSVGWTVVLSWAVRALLILVLGYALVMAVGLRGLNWNWIVGAVGAGVALLLLAPWRSGDPLSRFYDRVAFRAVDFLLAIALLGVLALPRLQPFVPLVVAAVVLAAWLSGRLSWAQTAVVAAAIMVTLLAWRQIEYHIPLLPGEAPVDLRQLWLDIYHQFREPAGLTALIALAAGVGMWAVSRIGLRAWANLAFLAEGAMIIGLVGYHSARPLLQDPGAHDEWVQAQEWARDHTDVKSMFLTPPLQSGFRIFSDRSVVSEWRDGTQGYFSAAFASKWWKQQQLLRPNIMYDEHGRRQLNPGLPLAQMPDPQLLKLAKETDASYIVLPTSAKGRGLKLAYSNPRWSIYEARSIVPDGVIDRDAWIAQDQFMTQVVQPNIEKYRKSDVKIDLVDAQGRPLSGVTYQVHQTTQRFGFGASLAFFEPVKGSGPDYKPIPVDPRELELFPQVFNYSVIPFSAKWMYLEPVEGEKHYEDLDKYVNWCTQHHIRMEYHYLAGMPPAWLRRKSSSELRDLVYNHCMEVVERYHDRIKTYQVTNDSYYIGYLGPVFRALRAKYPDLKLGTSECTMFYPAMGSPMQDIYRGLPEVQSLKAAGTPLDFFSFHAHKPYGIWPDARQIYDSINKFAAEGVKVHISEAVFPIGGRAGGIEDRFGGDDRGLPAQIVGPLRRGTWTPELQAEFAEWFYTVCFSHPDCEAINYWNFGPDTLLGGAGLVDSNYKPKPIFNRLKALIRGKWMTNIPVTELTGGEIAFRGFHGGYELTVTLPDGRTAKGTFSIEPGEANQYRMQLDETKGTLEAVK